MNKNKKLGFTLAEVLIVIGIIGVVAALTLPNLNHATGDKETVTRLQKAYSILNEANDRAVAIYGPVSTWQQKSDECKRYLGTCWMRRIGEFLKISKSCDESNIASNADNIVTCESLLNGDMETGTEIVYQLQDGITFTAPSGDYGNPNCNTVIGGYDKLNDICITSINIDINGPTKGQNKFANDIFYFNLSDSVGLIPYHSSRDTYEESVSDCLSAKDYDCSFWPFEFGNLDYLKADEEGKCNDSNIILDGKTNTSCH